jgi:hypothetical protein
LCLFILKIKCEPRVKFEFENFKLNRNRNKTKKRGRLPVLGLGTGIQPTVRLFPCARGPFPNSTALTRPLPHGSIYQTPWPRVYHRLPPPCGVPLVRVFFFPQQASAIRTLVWSESPSLASHGRHFDLVRLADRWAPVTASPPLKRTPAPLVGPLGAATKICIRRREPRI